MEQMSSLERATHLAHIVKTWAQSIMYLGIFAAVMTIAGKYAG